MIKSSSVQSLEARVVKNNSFAHANNSSHAVLTMVQECLTAVFCSLVISNRLTVVKPSSVKESLGQIILIWSELTTSQNLNCFYTEIEKAIFLFLGAKNGKDMVSPC